MRTALDQKLLDLHEGTVSGQPHIEIAYHTHTEGELYPSSSRRGHRGRS